ncbi:TetR/AcrR family transcriptional regulator [Actinokineospora sp. NBRC 105648]|uniref:TetR/AcrR family transcriptional regulator n=1 Tax=Actinokineospora sp. NBRC 105648 TaxID=3032206 RepID=UPI0024A3D319|nr:TetR/AcrR family transcriptional regulator [Actinokineospora sp. NBRC 105648]GLZ42018.1 hypothetical protein Acsp05_56420 [Actinokineospora sp. NBRC 105648]
MSGVLPAMAEPYPSAPAPREPEADPPDARPGRRPPGRPRSERAGQAIILATLEMLVEGESIDSLSMEAVAARAGVGKATLYRRWSNKRALISYALESLYEPIEAVECGSVRQDLIAALTELCRWLVETTSGRLLPHLVSGGRRAPELYERYLRAVVEPRREAIRGILFRGVRDRQLDPDLDVETTLGVLFGSVLSCVAVTTDFTECVGGVDGAGGVAERTVDLVLFGALPAT